MCKTKLIFLIVFLMIPFFLFAQSGFDVQSYYTEHPPVRYDLSESGNPRDFFEREYRECWESLTEYEQFAIACSCIQFYMNTQFPLDFTNHIVFDESRPSGALELRINKVYSYEDLIKKINDLDNGGFNKDYVYHKSLLEKYPELSILEIAKKEVLTVLQIERLYMVKDKMDILGCHNLEAWNESKKICLIRWGMGAGYLTKEEGTELIKPIVQKLKDDYYDFLDFMAQYFAGDCYDALYTEDNYDGLRIRSILVSAVACSRAYMSLDDLPFTGKNADENHKMELPDGIFEPSESAEKVMPYVNAFYKYKTYKASKEVLQAFVDAENEYPEIADYVFTPKLVLMSKISSAEECIDFIENNLDYVYSLPIEHEEYSFILQLYFSYLLQLYRPQKLMTVYDSLPDSVKIQNEYYFCYGYANYLMTHICKSIIERDIYASRAKTVFLRLRNNDFDIGESMNCWVEQFD